MGRTQAEIDEAVAMIRRHWSARAAAGVILGTGMAPVADRVTAEAILPYGDIPHFPATTALGHGGRLICGTLSGTSVVVMDGRHHAYEGHSFSTITFPVRVMRELGAGLLVVSNASGGINPEYRTGEIMIVEDHINFLWGNVLPQPTGDSDAVWVSRAARPFDPDLIDLALKFAGEEQIVAHRGVYVAMTGPNYETRAEYRFLRSIGGDAVGMSTVPEAMVAAQCGLRVLAISTITNVAHAETLEKTDGQGVLSSAETVAPAVAKISERLVADWTGAE